MALTKISGSILKDPLNLGEVSIGGTLTYQDVTNVDSVGIITARSTIDAQGDVSIADKIIHTGDTNTAIRFPAVDTISFETSGSERLRIESGGTLFSKSPSDATPNFKFISDDTNWHGYLNQTVHGATISTILSCGGTWTVDGTTYNATKDYNGSFGTAALIVHNQYNNTATGGELVFVTKANGSTTTDGAVSERFRITSDGKIGIGGATSPEELLDLGNDLQVNLKVGGRAYLGQGYSTAATILGHSVKAKTTGTVSGGMEVTETNSGGGAPAAIRMQNGRFEFHTAASGTSGATFDNEKLRIDSSGHVMIGTTTEGFATYGDQFTIANSGHCGMTIRSGTSNYGTIYFSDGDDGSADEVRGFIDYNHSNNQLQIGTNAATRLRIDSSGNVTKPNSFHILVDRNGNQTGYNACNMSDVIEWNRVRTSESSSGAASYFDTSTGLFTAPVTGLYLFHVAVNCSYAVQGAWLNINGSRPNFANFYPNGALSADAMITYKVTAGHTVGVKWYYNCITNGTINSNALHTWWRIVLLG